MKKNENPEVIEKPRICCLDLAENENESLIKSGANIYVGTLGSKIKIPNKKKYDNHKVLLNLDFPKNLHEFDIIIINLKKTEIIDYNVNENTREIVTGKSTTYLLSSFPENIFNPRPLSSYILKDRLNNISERTCMIIAFSAKDYECEYEPVKVTEDYEERQKVENYGIYSFLENAYLSDEKYGKEINVLDVREDLKSILLKYTSNATYSQTFYHPSFWNDGKRKYDENFVPLMKNMNNDIISYFLREDNFRIFMLPQINNKESFLVEFLQKVAPSIYPELFPFSTQFNWLNNIEYFLPKHEQLLEEEKQIKLEYEKKLISNEKRILENTSKYQFLHDLLTETSDNLVRAIEKYLHWLEFADVRNMDKISGDSKVLEEDLQVDIPQGLLIIEAKGIGGTSTDSDCSQISKIKHRRCKERNKFDVFALYIVNHQRYLPPLKRQNPPFSDNQMQDAKNDERGLLSTWQLFNLYFDVKKGIISKKEAKERLIEFGLIEFKPKNLIYIDEPKRFYENGLISIINIKDVNLKTGQSLYIEMNGKFAIAKIVSLMINDKQVQEVDNGEIGLKLDMRLKNRAKLWKR